MDVNDSLRAAGLPVRPCGLNADWAVSAWHLGPHKVPNTHEGDLYLVDNEQGTEEEEVYEIVRRHYDLMGVAGDGFEEVELVAGPMMLDAAIADAARRLGKAAR